MYIVTLEELDQKTNEWRKTYRMFETRDETLDFLEVMTETAAYNRTRNVKLWYADELHYECKMHVDITVDWR